MLAKLITRPCIISTPIAGEQDDFDLDDDDPSEPVEVETVCEIQQRRSDERGDAGETSDSDWVGFFLVTDSVRTSSTIICEGESFEVVGDPWRARWPDDGVESHIEVPLRRTAGAGDEVGS